MDPDTLKNMIEEDEFGLLDVKEKPQPMTGDERIVAGFAEITEFYRREGREPKNTSTDMAEFQLAARLKALRENPAHSAALAEHDEFGLLAKLEPPKSIEEALASDTAGLLTSPEESILDTSALPKVKVTSMPDDVARRKKCEDFDSFKGLFEDCHKEIRVGTRRVIPFRNEQEIRAGAFYVQAGVLLYVAEMGERYMKSGKSNARLRCIYENGTESGVLLRSLSAELYKNGRIVTDPNAATLEQMGLAPDTPLASVYVLRSHSESPEVDGIPNLHKIGSTSQDVEKRISGASNEATFLGAPVSIAAEYQVPKGAEKGLEKLLHHFFANVRLDIWFENSDGLAVAEAHEWFSVPLELINEAIGLIEAETISEFRYDSNLEQIVLAA